MRSIPSALAPLVVTFRPDPDGYGTVSCSWEEKPREQRIARSAAARFAEGWRAELKVEAPW